MNLRSTTNSKIIIYNLNDKILNESRAFILEQITNKLKEYYSQYIDFPIEFWRKLVADRLETKENGTPFTLVALRETSDGKRQFLGTISAEYGCIELNDTDNVWICGLYVEPAFRKQGIALSLCKEILEKFQSLNLSSFRLWAIDPNLDKLYANAGAVELDRPVVLNHQIVVRSGETDLILKNILKMHNKENSYLTSNHSTLYSNLSQINSNNNANIVNNKSVNAPR